MRAPATADTTPSLTAPTPTPHAVGGAAAPTRGRLLTGRVLSGLAVAFLLFDTVIKLVQARMAVESTVQLGYSPRLVLVIGVIELLCLTMYVVPRTAVLGAIVLTGYLGGAVATQVRAENPLVSYVLFPTYVAAVLWAGLYLREPRLRALLPFRL